MFFFWEHGPDRGKSFTVCLGSDREIDENGEGLSFVDAFHATGDAGERAECFQRLLWGDSESLSTPECTESIFDVEFPWNAEGDLGSDRI